MEELVFEKKKYVSSRRAARISGYTKDYIGQLCRAGALPAKMVGRNWYIDEDALKEHRKTYQGEAVVDQSLWDIDHVTTDSRPLSEVVRQYIGDEEVKRRNELLENLFKLTYHEEKGEDLIPNLEKEKERATKNTTVNLREEESFGQIDSKDAEDREDSLPEPQPVGLRKEFIRKSAHVLTLSLQKKKRPLVTYVPDSAKLHTLDQEPTRGHVIRREQWYIPQNNLLVGERRALPMITLAFILVTILITGVVSIERVSTFYVKDGTYVESSGGIGFSIFGEFVKQLETPFLASPHKLD
ncbi:MAG TPA: hypothetical protein VJH21_00705 [Candidatus Paceibacterota bacterium]